MLIPAKRGAARDDLDSVFLRRYALRIERQAKRMSFTQAVMWGAFGLLVMVVIGFVKQNLGLMYSAVPLVQLLPFMPHPAEEVRPLLEWWDYVVPAVMAVIGGFRGQTKADELRFESQMALHILKVHEMGLALEDKINE